MCKTCGKLQTDPLPDITCGSLHRPRFANRGPCSRSARAENQGWLSVPPQHAAGVKILSQILMRGTPYLMRVALGIPRPKSPRLGVDFAGTVEGVGSRVARFKLGDEVFGVARGSFAEYVTVPEARGGTSKPP